MALINIRLQLDADQFNAESTKATAGVERFGGKAEVSFDSVTAKAAAFSFAFNQIAIIATSVTTALAAPIEKFSQFETSIHNIGSLGVENISGIQASILDLSTNVAVPIANLSAGMYQVVSAGVAANEQIGFLEVTSKAAKAGLAESTDAINLASTVVKGYGKDWNETESILDQAFQTVKLGQTTFPELAASMGQTVPLASALKIETKELFGAFATLTGVTGGTSEVATQLKAVFTGLAAPTDDLSRLVKQHGFATVEDAAAQQGLSGILKLLQEATGGSAAKMGELFGSVEAVNALLALAGPQYDSFKTKTDAMTNSAGEMQKAYEINSDTIAAHADILQNKLDKAQIEVIESLRPIIVGVIDLAGELVDLDWTPFIVGATASGVALAAFNFPAIVAGFASLTTAVATFGGVLATSTGGITLAIGVLATLTTAIINSIPSESELARERKKTAEETKNIIQAELDRVRQAKDTGGATDELVTKEKRLTEQLIMQQRIISDANMLLYGKQLREASKDFDSFVDSSVAAGLLMRRMPEELMGDIVGMSEFSAKRSNDIALQLQNIRIGEAKATESGIVMLTKQKVAYEEFAKAIAPAAEAQKNLNSETENQKRLIETMRSGVALPKSGGTPAVNAPPIVQTVEFKEIRPKEINLPMVELDNFEAIQQNEIQMVDLKFQNHLDSEEEYLNQRRNLLAVQAQFMMDFYGEDSRQYLEANLRKIQFDEELTRKKQQLEQQAQRNTLSITANLMANAQGVNEALFGIGKGASIAQATVDTYAAANLALKTYPPPFGAIAAAVNIATGLVNVAKITATKFERKAEGGFLGDGFRSVLDSDFGGGENGLFIGNTGEFIVNAASAHSNRALLELINASEGAVRLNAARQAGGSIGGSSAGSQVDGLVTRQDLSEIVEAIREVQINLHLRAELDAMHFMREAVPAYEKEEARRRLA